MKDEIIKLRLEGKSYNIIAKILGCTKSKIARCCSMLENNIEITKSNEKIVDYTKDVRVGFNKLSDDIRNKIISLYLDGKNISEVSRETVVSRFSVRNILRKENLLKEEKKVKKENKELVKNWRTKTKLKLVEYKGGECVKCGYNKCIAALEFHHLDPKQKDFNISSKGWSFDKLKNEADKCIMVCNRCHIEIHQGLILV